MNITSGSLEALGGDVSRGDLETSDLITCIADLQFNNQKLQEENSQLKLALDTMEEANNRLMENIEELRNQIKSFQQSMIGVRSLKEELEEMKISLNSSEENRLKMSAQKKQLEKENHSLNLKISSLQEENIRNSLDLDGLQKKVIELTQSTAELQMQMHLYENTVANKDTVLLKKDLDIQELKSSLKEYSSVLETLRGEKNKLVNTVQQMQQELISNGISIPLLCKFNSSILEGSHSLHCELELAQEQSQIIGFEWTALDESLNREVLLLLQGPEQVGDKFKDTIQKLQEELYHLEDFAGFDAVWTADSDTNVQEAYEKKLVNLKQHLGNKRTLWLKKLEILDTQKGSLDKELIKMAGNLRRMRTEQLHLKKELASKQHEVELVKQLKEDAVSEGDILRLSLQKETKLLEDANSQIKDLESNLQVACENAISLQKRLEESFAERGLLHAINVNLIHSCQELELKTKEHSTILDLLRDKNIKGVFSGVLYKKTCCYKRLGAQEFLCFGLSWLPTLQRWCLEYSPLLDALTLDSLQLIRGSFMIKAYGNLSNSEEQHLNDGSVLIVTLERCKCSNYSMGNQTYADLLSGTRMDADCTEESSAVLLTDVLSSSEQVSSQEVSSSTLEGSSEAQDINSTLPNAMEEKFCEVSPGMEEATTVEEANEEDQTAVFGNDSSAENLSNNALTRNREKGIISPNEKEMEAEFLRLSLGFKCDLFTLEKRVRLEERSRDLAEGNLKKEIATALKLLESLASLSEDNQIQEIVKKLEKSLELLNQYAIRVASKAEMLGAIHQSSSLRRVSIATLPRNTGNAGTGLPMAQLNDTDWNDKCDKVSRRASWGLVAAKQGEKRPLLQRYISSHSWTESEEEQPETESIPLERPASEIRGNKMQKLSEKENSSPRWGLYSVYTRVLSWASCLRTSKAFCIYATTAVLFAFLSSLILGLSFQRPVDAAPAETGDAWTSVQQLLWPYIGLRHQGPPPV